MHARCIRAIRVLLKTPSGSFCALSPRKCLVQRACSPEHLHLQQELSICAGTIFHSILLWRCAVADNVKAHTPDGACTQHIEDASAPCPMRCIASATVPPALRLLGHGGSLMKVKWAFEGQMILSAADDRTASMWCLPSGGMARSVCMDFKPTVSLWGHQARVWDIVCGNRCGPGLRVQTMSCF